jgi:hypothetical protein
VEIALGGSTADFPRLLLVEGSEDGEAWTQLWRGATGGLAVAGGLDDPARVPVQVVIPPTRVRFVRLQQLGSDPSFFWSVAELVVRAPPG